MLLLNARSAKGSQKGLKGVGDLKSTLTLDMEMQSFEFTQLVLALL